MEEMVEIIKDSIVVKSNCCKVELALLEREQFGVTLHVVSFKIGDDEPKETSSRDGEFIESLYISTKAVIL